MAASGCSSPIPTPPPTATGWPRRRRSARERLGLAPDANHVHLIVVPQDEDGLRRALARVHRRYAGLIHARAANRPFLAGTIRRRGDGRGPSRRRPPHREPQSGARPSRRAGRGLAVVERARPSGPRRGWPDRPRARPPTLFPLRRPPRSRRGRRGDGAPHAKARALGGRSARTHSSPRWKPGHAAASTPSSGDPSQSTTERPRPRSKLHCHRNRAHTPCHRKRHRNSGVPKLTRQRYLFPDGPSASPTPRPLDRVCQAFPRISITLFASSRESTAT